VDKPNALEFFRGEHRYNCAQAVLMAYAPAIGVGGAYVERFSQYGSGRAPGGECGALFAAKAIVEDAAARSEVEREFMEFAGTTKCREIRQDRRISCQQCVQTAADAVFRQVTGDCVLRCPPECAI
jgi:hypothetical protein